MDAVPCNDAALAIKIMFQWQNWPSPTMGVELGSTSPSGAGAGSIYKIWNHTLSWAYKCTTEFQYLNIILQIY
jgi:hypothetical protein